MAIPDHSLEAEQYILCALLIDPDSHAWVIDELTDEHFKAPQNAQIMSAIRYLSERNLDIDVFSVGEHCQKTAAEMDLMPYLTSLCESAPGVTEGFVRSYIRSLGEYKRRREIYRAIDSIAVANREEKSVEDVVGVAEKALSELTKESKSDYTTFAQAGRKALDSIERRFERKEGELVGIPTGITQLDQHTLGLDHGLHVVAARPAMGKTVFAMNNVCLSAAKAGGSVAVFSLEMSDEQLAERAMAALGNIEYRKIREAKTLTQEDFQGVARAIELMNALDITFFEQSESDIHQIRSNIRAWHRRSKNPSCAMIDYLGLIKCKGMASRAEEIGEATRILKSLSKELRIPIVLLSQLNRSLEQRPNKRPILSDLRESGAIEQDADSVFFLYRDEVYDENSRYRGICELIGAKIRNGETKTIFMASTLNKQKFSDLSPEWREPEAETRGRRI